MTQKDRFGPRPHRVLLSEEHVNHMPVRVLLVTDIHMNEKYPQCGQHAVGCGSARESFLKEMTVKLTPES